MASIHGHEVLHMILSSKVAFYAKITYRGNSSTFWEDIACFHTCSAENMTAAELVAF